MWVCGSLLCVSKWYDAYLQWGCVPAGLWTNVSSVFPRWVQCTLVNSDLCWSTHTLIHLNPHRLPSIVRSNWFDLLEGVPVTQDKAGAGARGELGHWVPSPTLPPLGRKGRCDPSSPDGAKLQARCQLHCSTHLHMLETERRRSSSSVATDRTRRNRKHDTNTHTGTLKHSHIKLPIAVAEQALTVFLMDVSPSALICPNAENVSEVKGIPHPRCPEGWDRGKAELFPGMYGNPCRLPARPNRSVQSVCA